MRRAVGSLARLLEEMLANETIARHPGLLQGIDARAKVIGLVALIVTATLVHRVSTLAVAGALVLLFAAWSRVPMARVLRAWLAVPLFSAAIVLPALLNIITPGQPVLTVWRFSSDHLGPWAVPPVLTITDAGLYVAGRFILRVTVCVTLALLLTATTPAARLFRGLRALGVPTLFIMLLTMMGRYLSVLTRVAEEIHLAKLSRTVVVGPLRGEQAWVAAGMGSLFRRTQRMSEQVHLAMISRGYTGEVRLLDDPRWGAADWAFLLIAVGTIAIMAILG